MIRFQTRRCAREHVTQESRLEEKNDVSSRVDPRQNFWVAMTAQQMPSFHVLAQNLFFLCDVAITMFTTKEAAPCSVGPAVSWAHRQPATHSWSLLECAVPGRSSQVRSAVFQDRRQPATPCNRLRNNTNIDLSCFIVTVLKACLSHSVG